MLSSLSMTKQSGVRAVPTASIGAPIAPDNDCAGFALIAMAVPEKGIISGNT